MGNIKNFNANKLDFALSNSDYWDLFLSSDEGPIVSCTGLTSGDSFVVWYDFNNSNIFSTGSTSADTISSLVSWNGAVNSGYTMDTFGLTGIDNGAIIFDKVSGDTTNQALLSALTGTTLVIPSGDTRLKLTRVTGTTGNYIYPIDILSGTSGTFAQLCGGFYQGYYKLDGTTYQVLPIREYQAWSAEFWVKPQDLCSYTGTTLNDIYPNNKGIFFYMGTRAENKFWNTFEGVDTGCTSGCTVSSGCTGTTSQWCTLPRETDIVLTGGAYNVGVPLNPPLINIDLIENGFLIYGRGTGNSYCGSVSDGLGEQTVNTYSGGGQIVVTHSQTVVNKTNPFLIYGRGTGMSYCGEVGDGLGRDTVSTFTGFTEDQKTLDYKMDIIDNAIAFRIKDDGSIGYRSMTITGTCTSANTYVSGVSITEDYSLSGMVSPNAWSYIAIRFVMPYYDDCELKLDKPRKGNLMIYVNAKLKKIFYEVDEMVARRLNDSYMKQVGVPFNFSLGGGSQGLIDSQTFDGLDMSDRGLPIETNFAGSFIGGISEFKFNIDDLSYCDIQYNYLMGLPKHI